MSKIFYLYMDHHLYIAKLNKDGSYSSPLAHCMDAAALAQAITKREPESTIQAIAAGLGIDRNSTCVWIAYLAGLHDLMKLSWAFQLMSGIRTKFIELNPTVETDDLRDHIHNFCERRGYNFIPQRESKNTTISPIQHALLLPPVLPELLVQITGVSDDIANSLTIAPAGHHSLYPTESIAETADDYINNPLHGEQHFDELRKDLCQRIWDVLRGAKAQRPKYVTATAIMHISALIQRADQTASREHRFPLQNGGCRAWEDTQAMAQKILDVYGYQKLEPMARPTFEQLGVQARPMQQIIQDLDLTNPYCMFVKAGTGMGKTIASIQAALGDTGFVFAANNQTTAGSIYKAIDQIIAKVHPDLKQAVALAHANRMSFIERWQENLIQENPSDERIIRSKFELQSENIQDCLTAPYLVATIDQILMSIFNDGRFVYRMPQLISKTNIIDEVHTLDGRLQSLLLVYLTILGKFKVPTILLSATISSQQMNELMEAWATGAGMDYEPVTLQSDDEIIFLKADD